MELTIQSLLNYYDKHRHELEAELFEYLRFKSVSTDPSYKDEVLACATWVEDLLKSCGFQTERWEGAGHPTIFGEWLGAGPDKPTLLLYGHYDVQPPEPLELWLSPPFEPTVRDGKVFARGATDNKGQSYYFLAALRTILRENGSLPINIKVLIEGEEEASSRTLHQLLSIKSDKIKADYILIVDVDLAGEGDPAITLGVRGIVAGTLHLAGSSVDLHSGGFGGIVYNPLNAMGEILGKLRDSNGKILVPGFYDDVQPLLEVDRNRLALEVDLNLLKDKFGAQATGGESGIAPGERNWCRPTFEINGVSGGYAGAGFKTVIPAKAFFKFSCRLVPNQNPKKIFQQVKEYLLSLVPPGITAEIEVHDDAGQPMRTSPDSHIAKVCAQAFSECFNKPCKMTLTGGSIPIAAEIGKYSGGELLFIGFMLPTDNLHAPNEHIGLDRVRQGFATIGRIVELLGAS